MRAILAKSKNNVLGNGLEIPWMGKYPQDMKFFREMTSNGVVIMGYNTWKSLGKPLKNRLNVVISREEKEGDVIFTRELDLDKLEKLSGIDRSEFWVIGGLKTYEKYKSQITEFYVTEIPEEVQGDVILPDGFFQGLTREHIRDIFWKYS
jgi:dihydrofolate reductase